MAWSGIRGAVSLAVALALPLTTDVGGGFPKRDLIIFLTFAVIFFTLVVQGLSLPAVIRRLGGSDLGADADEEGRARLVATKAAIEQIHVLAGERGIGAMVVVATLVTAVAADSLRGATPHGRPNATAKPAAKKQRTKTWYVSAAARRHGNGSRRAPFHTLSALERVSRPGDKIVMLPVPKTVAPLNGGVLLKPRQRPVGARAAGAGRTKRLERPPGLSNTSGQTPRGD